MTNIHPDLFHSVITCNLKYMDSTTVLIVCGNYFRKPILIKVHSSNNMPHVIVHTVSGAILPRQTEGGIITIGPLGMGKSPCHHRHYGDHLYILHTTPPCKSVKKQPQGSIWIPPSVCHSQHTNNQHSNIEENLVPCILIQHQRKALLHYSS